MKNLEKQNKKYKKIIVILSSIIVIGILCAMFLVYAYFFRNNKIVSNMKKGIDEYKYSLRIKYEDVDKKNNENYHNSMYRLKLKSSYGDNQGTHPKVINFDEPWNGYKYWMVYSPYPYNDDYRENPTIKVSNDKVNWEEPDGLVNPIVNTPENYIKEKIYNSDPHLVYNNDTDTLECYYRYVNDIDDVVIIYRLTSKDGVNFSDKEEILKSKRSEKDYVSPAIIYEDGVYKIWYCNKKSVYYIESSDLKNFTIDRKINIEYYNDSIFPWHIDVIKSDLGYELISVGMYNWNDRRNMNLYYSVSSDNESWSKSEVIIKPSNEGWDNSGLYRSSFIKEDGVYHVYYSGISSNIENGIGLSYGKDIRNLKGITEE